MIRKWLPVRFIRAMCIMVPYVWRAHMIWGITTPKELRESGMYAKEREHAIRVLMGEE